MTEPVPLETSVIEAQRMLAAEAGTVRLVDVRDPEEYEFCRLRGAELIPLATLPADAVAKLPDKDAHILLYCHHGMRSLRAAEMLRQLGYKNATSMAGGIDRWSKEIDSLVPTY